MAAYWTVLLAELLGDKTVYTVASLAVRFRPGVVFGATIVAFAGKMLAAVLLGSVMVHFLANWTAALSAVALFISAALIWFRKPEPRRSETLAARGWSQAAIVSFASVFLTEWGDPGQIAAAALAAQSKIWVAVWFGGTLALTTKAAVALTVGLKLRNWMPDGVLRGLAAASCCVLGFLSLVGLTPQ
jgi:Ca2+/H+ antiporter, TMEM165/GDT1 family